MDSEDMYVVSAYKEIAPINESHNVWLCQNQCTGKLYVKKDIGIYNKSIYDWLMKNPVKDMPRIVAAVESGNTLTVIEEYISGDTLETLLGERGTLSEKETVFIAKSLCNILSELHKADPSIIHRDIKPSNIILSSDGVVKLLDMNAAKWFSEGESSDTRLMGTAGFAAPEQYGFMQSSPQTDIYAVGALMSTMLYGKLPQQASLDGNIGKIIKKCTEMRPDERYGSVAELSKALNEVSGVCITDAADGKDWLKYFPPGFRSLDPGHMIIATLGYVLLFSALPYFTFEEFSTEGRVISRIFIVLSVLCTIFFTFDYLGVQKKLPLTNKSNLFLRLLGILFYDVLIMTAFAIMNIIIVSVI